LFAAGIEVDFLFRSVAASPDFGHYVSLAHAEITEVSNINREDACARADMAEGELS